MSTVSVPLSSPKYPGLFALIDEEDADLIRQYRWGVERNRACLYAVGRRRDDNGNIVSVQMHRLIIDPPDHHVVDHKDGNGLHNCRSNLRAIRTDENAKNRGVGVNNTSGYKGVSFHKRDKVWQAYITANRVRRFLGYYTTADDAARAYDVKARELHGVHARLNFPDAATSDAPTPCRTRTLHPPGSRGVRQRRESWGYSAKIAKRGMGTIHLGTFKTVEEAARAYDRKARELHGDRARLNYPNG